MLVILLLLFFTKVSMIINITIKIYIWKNWQYWKLVETTSMSVTATTNVLIKK